MNGHAPREHCTNTGDARVVCECGWSSASYGSTTLNKRGRPYRKPEIGLDPAYREHGRHVAALARTGSDD